MRRLLLAVMTLWWREVIRFFRQRSRLISAFAQPLVFWLLLGAGLGQSFRPTGAPETTGYFEYLYAGIMVLVLLFTAIFATISRGIPAGCTCCTGSKVVYRSRTSARRHNLSAFTGCPFSCSRARGWRALEYSFRARNGGNHIPTLLWVD